MQGQRAAGDAKLAVLAAKQHGVVAYWQLIRLGFAKGAIEQRVRSGRLHRKHRGVYAVGHPLISRRGELMAAVLACGPGALLSHWSAAELWEFLPRRRSFIDVVSTSRSRKRTGIVCHEGANLEMDRAMRHNIPVTSPSRTLLDLAAVGEPKQLAEAIEAAERSRWLNHREMRKLIDRNERRPGVKALRVAMAAYDPLLRRTRSILERDFLRECRRLEVPEPQVNTQVEGFEVDMYWPGARLILELDSWEFHKTRAAFERDRRRDAQLERNGYRVLRVTYEWLAENPTEVAETVAALLRAQSSENTSGLIAYSA